MSAQVVRCDLAVAQQPHELDRGAVGLVLAALPIAERAAALHAQKMRHAPGTKAQRMAESADFGGGHGSAPTDWDISS